MDRSFSSSRLRLAAASGLIAALAACGTPTSNPSPAAIANASPDARGVITYASYQVAVARDGDTVASLAARVGGSAAEISRMNGLPVDHRLRAGEVLVLPDSVARPGAIESAPAWTPEAAAAAIDAAPAASATPGPFQGGQTDPLIDPIRHRVEAGETVYSIARLYGVSVTALASWNGLGPDMALRVGQELLIPIVSSANQITTSLDTAPGQGTQAPPPPIAATPLPENVAPGTPPPGPNLGAQRTPAGGRLQAPVSASVSRAFNPANPNGVGFAAPAGTPVRAAGAGEVALTSEDIARTGTIVMIRHDDDLITSYSVLSGVRVQKGDRVSAGQVIGAVAERERPEFQFDVFRGTEPLDPTIYIGG